jgi:hypothetical protein
MLNGSGRRGGGAEIREEENYSGARRLEPIVHGLGASGHCGVGIGENGA